MNAQSINAMGYLMTDHTDCLRVHILARPKVAHVVSKVARRVKGDVQRVTGNTCNVRTHRLPL